MERSQPEMPVGQTQMLLTQISLFKYSNKFDEWNFQKNQPTPIDVRQNYHLFQKKQPGYK